MVRGWRNWRLKHITALISTSTKNFLGQNSGWAGEAVHYEAYHYNEMLHNLLIVAFDKGCILSGSGQCKKRAKITTLQYSKIESATYY